MAVVGVVSQKGGIGKSTLCQALVTEATRSGLRAKLADLDALQSTSVEWHRVRLAQGVEPAVDVQGFGSLAAALRDAVSFDYLVLDGPARSTSNTLAVARAADLVIQPTGCSSADLRPAVRLFNELAAGGILRGRLVMVLSRIGSDPEERDARAFIQEAGFAVVPGSIPERPAYRTAQNRGRALSEVSILSLRRRCEQVLEKIGELLDEDEIPAQVGPVR
jgi:chromosome partitioning protein